MLCRVVSCRVVLSCLVLSYLVLSCLVVSCLVLSCRVVSWRVLPCPILSFLTLSCLFLSCLAQSCVVSYFHVVSCRVVFCLALSCPVLSCFALCCVLCGPALSRLALFGCLSLSLSLSLFTLLCNCVVDSLRTAASQLTGLEDFAQLPWPENNPGSHVGVARPLSPCGTYPDNTGINGGNEYNFNALGNFWGDVQAIYEEGEEVTLTWKSSQNHLGSYSYRVCDYVQDLRDIQDECYAAPLLKEVGTGREWLEIQNEQPQLNFTHRFQLPDGLTCDRCVLVWRWDSLLTHVGLCSCSMHVFVVVVVLVVVVVVVFVADVVFVVVVVVSNLVFVVVSVSVLFLFFFYF